MISYCVVRSHLATCRYLEEVGFHIEVLVLRRHDHVSNPFEHRILPVPRPRSWRQAFEGGWVASSYLQGKQLRGHPKVRFVKTAVLNSDIASDSKIDSANGLLPKQSHNESPDQTL